MATKSPLQPIEVRFLNAFGLTKDDIYADDIVRLESKEVTDKETWEVKELDATTYINIKWLVLGRKYLSVKIYTEKTENNLLMFTNEKLEVADEEWNEYKSKQISREEFVKLLSERVFSLATSI